MKKHGNMEILMSCSSGIGHGNVLAAETHRAGGGTVVESICMCNQGAGPRGGQFLGVF